MNDILTKAEVAALLDCEESTVEEKARTRELPGVKIGRSWVFPREALLQRLNEMALALPTPRADPLAIYDSMRPPKLLKRPALPSLEGIK